MWQVDLEYKKQLLIYKLQWLLFLLNGIYLFPSHIIALGEISLTGEIYLESRHINTRIKEAIKMGNNVYFYLSN